MKTVKLSSGEMTTRVWNAISEALGAKETPMVMQRKEQIIFAGYLTMAVMRRIGAKRGKKKACPDPEAHEKGDLLFPCDHKPAPAKEKPKRIPTSSCCDAVMVNPGWCPCCDHSCKERPAAPEAPKKGCPDCHGSGSVVGFGESSPCGTCIDRRSRG